MAEKAQSTRAAKEEQLVAAIRHRTEQLASTGASIVKLKQALQSIKAKTTENDRFISHLAGFYEEIDKLAKGKSLFQATDIIVEGANNIIRDARLLIDGDIYIDRLKEFVPAGDNPVYPDILMTARTIQQATVRFKEALKTRTNGLATAVREAETIKCALSFFVEDNGHIASKEEIERTIDNPLPIWFSNSPDVDDADYSDDNSPFDFARLDAIDLSEHFTAALTATVDGEK